MCPYALRRKKNWLAPRSATYSVAETQECDLLPTLFTPRVLHVNRIARCYPIAD